VKIISRDIKQVLERAKNSYIDAMQERLMELNENKRKAKN